MPEEFTKKENKLRIDKERNLIFIPGQDSPKELIAPIVQRFDAEGNPYQHVVSATELIEAEESHKRSMKFLRDAMKHDWKCQQCGRTWPGTQMQPSTEMLDRIGRMFANQKDKPINWHEILEEIILHMHCPGSLPAPEVGACKGRCVPVREVPS